MTQPLIPSRLPSDAGRARPCPWLRVHGRAGSQSQPNTDGPSSSWLARITKFLVSIFLVLAGCSDERTTPLMVGTNIWPGYEPLYLAQAQGLYSDRDIRLVQHPSASEVIRAFRNGAIPVAAVTLDEALLMLADGMQIKVILVIDSSAGGDVILGRPPIIKMEDLRGKHVGCEASALGAFVLCRAAELHGLDCHKDMSVVDLEVDEHETAFSNGAIDAVVTFEPIRTRLLASGAKLLFDSREIPNEIIDVLVVRPEVIRDRKLQLKKLLDGWFRALAYMDAHPVEAAAIMGPREQLSGQQFTAALSGLKILKRADNLIMLRGPQPRIAQAAAKLASFMEQRGLLPNPVSLSGFVSSGLVEESAP